MPILNGSDIIVNNNDKQYNTHIKTLPNSKTTNTIAPKTTNSIKTTNSMRSQVQQFFSRPPIQKQKQNSTTIRQFDNKTEEYPHNNKTNVTPESENDKY